MRPRSSSRSSSHSAPATPSRMCPCASEPKVCSVPFRCVALRSVPLRHFRCVTLRSVTFRCVTHYATHLRDDDLVDDDFVETLGFGHTDLTDLGGLSCASCASCTSTPFRLVLPSILLSSHVHTRASITPTNQTGASSTFSSTRTSIGTPTGPLSTRAALFVTIPLARFVRRVSV